MKYRIGFFVLFFSVIYLVPSGFSREEKALYPGFHKIEDCPAYSRFLEGSRNDYAKILFLIDRFAKANVKIRFDGHYFTPAFAGNFARSFFSAYYKGETPKQWIMKWCNTSVFTGDLIWVELPNKKFRLARDILLEEIKVLESHMDQKAQS